MDFEKEWQRCSPWLTAALAHAGDTHALDDVRRMVLAGQAQFWPGANAAAVTEVLQYGRCRALRVWLCGGNLAEIAAAEPRLVYWAIRQGCARVEIIGRAGWERALPGYGKHAVLLTKEIER